jgi:hypothetical protein
MWKKVVLSISLIILFLLPAFSWSAHREMTEIILKDLDWLKNYKYITVTAYTYHDTSPYNPSYIFPIVRKIGDKIDAVTIISRYVTEPDYGNG